jgi:hypothetical protein
LGEVVRVQRTGTLEQVSDSPMLLVFLGKVVCYACVRKDGLRAKPLTPELWESMRRPERQAPKQDGSSVKKPMPPPSVKAVASVMPRIVVQPIGYVPPRAPSPKKPPKPTNPVLSDEISARLKAELHKIALERAETVRRIRVGARDIPVVLGRVLAKAEPAVTLRPVSSRYSLDEPTVAVTMMGAPTPVYAPFREDVLTDVLETTECPDVELQIVREPTVAVQPRLLGLFPEKTQALRQLIKRHKKRAG